MEEIEACIAAPNTVEAEIEARELARIIEEFFEHADGRKPCYLHAPLLVL